jgi:hypothetical protein
MTFGPSVSNYHSVFATNGVDSEQCKDDEDYYEDHEKACDKDLRLHYGESQSSKQNSQVVSGGDSIGSGNNFSFQNQENSGSNALAQDGGDDGDGNSARQGIGQSQSSKQNSQVVSGGDSIGSGNNFSFQNQVNTGNNAAAQQ